MQAGTLDWVEAATGEPGGDVCERQGHDDYVASEPVMVNGNLAAFRECGRCGRRGFHWLLAGSVAVVGRAWPRREAER